MKWPEEVRAALRTRWDGHWRTWLGDGGEWPQRFSLGAPGEAMARGRWEEFRDWLAAWREAPFGSVDYATRRWPSLGAQEVPTHVSLPSPYAVAAALGRAEADQFALADQRWRVLAAAWPGSEDVLRRVAPWLGTCSTEDYDRWVSVLDWLVQHPRSGLQVRQLPVPGIHTKWVEANVGTLGPVLASRTQRGQGVPFAELAGLAVDPTRRRVRILDAGLRERLGGLGDITLALPDLAKLELPVTSALIVENLQTALAFGDLPGTILFVGGGFAVGELGAVEWLARVPILYWGDIDNAGFAILHTLRQVHPHARSVLMDEQTLLRHREMWSHDESRPGGGLTSLSPDEAAVYRNLGAGVYGPAVRLEQERVEWAWATKRVVEALQRSRQALAEVQGAPPRR